MAKAKPHPGQLGFCFEAPKPATMPAELAGLRRQVSEMVGTILASDGRSRAVIAAEMSELADDTVTKQMLDAYASGAREDHGVPFDRMLVLLAVTSRLDLLDPLLRRIGAALLVGEEVHTARLGNIDRQIAALRQEREQLAKSAPVIRGNRNG